MKFGILILSIASLFIMSCSESVSVGSEVLPGSDGSGNFFSDTTTIITSTVREDSLRSDKLLISQLGLMSEPVFGTTTSSLLTGFRAPSISLNPSILDTVGGYQLDSIVLALKINSIYGDSTQPMNFKVYKSLVPLPNDEQLFSTINFQQGMLEVGSIEGYIPSLSREYSEDDSLLRNLGSQLRINLNPFFGQSLINILGTERLESDVLFRQFLPGLIVVPETGGSVLELDMLTNASEISRANALQDSRLHLYYRNSNGDSLNIIFLANMLNLGVGKFEHNYEGSNIETALSTNNPDGDAINYVQGLAGVKTKIQFPFIDAYENAAVQKAELVITQLLDGQEDTYLPPQRLLVVKIDENGKNANITDFTRFSDAHLSGFSEDIMDENGITRKQYRINISDYMQSLIAGNEPNNGMFITLYGAQSEDLIALNTSDLIPDRIVIGGSQNTIDFNKLKLELTYTILE